MITDIYMKHPEDPGYTADQILEQEELSMLIAQIKMVLLTKKEAVLGSPQFGIDEESYLFEFVDSFNEAKIQNEIYSQLKSNCPLLFNRNWAVSVRKMKNDLDQYKESIHVLISIDDKVNFVIAYQ